MHSMSHCNVHTPTTAHVCTYTACRTVMSTHPRLHSCAHTQHIALSCPHTHDSTRVHIHSMSHCHVHTPTTAHVCTFTKLISSYSAMLQLSVDHHHHWKLRNVLDYFVCGSGQQTCSAVTGLTTWSLMDTYHVTLPKIINDTLTTCL
jgi:hypothetical protein